MNKVILSAETTCDLRENDYTDLSVARIDMDYRVGDTEHNTAERMPPKELYDKMRGGAQVKTSLVNEFAFVDIFKKLTESGNDVLHLSFSSALSGTCKNAQAAAETVNEENEKKGLSAKIAVVDSLCASGGQGLFVRIIADKLKARPDETLENLRVFAENYKMNISHLFIVDNLKYLARGGRISKATALIGNAIHMKPVMHVSDDGKLTPFLKVLSRRRSVMSLIAEYKKRAASLDTPVYVCHADAFEEAAGIADEVERHTGKRPEIGDIGVIIGGHSGPGTIALFFVGQR